MSKIVEISHESVLNRYRELSATLREQPASSMHTIVGFVDGHGQSFRFFPEEVCKDARFNALVNILGRVYSPRVIYAVHH